MRSLHIVSLLLSISTLLGCSGKPASPQPGSIATQPAPAFFKVDANTAGMVKGTIHFRGNLPAPRVIDMSEEPACVAAHHGKAYDESLVVSRHGGLANSFVYIASGLEGKTFAVPATPVTIDQSGCWFRPRILGIQTNQVLRVVNSDPVTHNIHPMAHMNREWNHSQGAGDPPLARRFPKPEIMIAVKCNIHSWMHAYIGVLSHPYFTVSAADGSFEIKDLPPGTYTLAVWQEKLGTQQQQITIAPSGKAETSFTFGRN